MVKLSKSKYIFFRRCPKLLWLDTYKSDEIVIDEKTTQKMYKGNNISDLAKGIFGDFVEVKAKDGEELDYAKR